MSDWQLDFILLIPSYNNLNGLRRSLESVNYPPSRFGLLIVDDGSDEPLTPGSLGPHIPTDTEIIRLPVNAGIVPALNTGMQRLAARKDFRFVARLDCGDVCAPGRFLRQVAYLDTHPEIDLLGTWVLFSTSDGKLSYLYKTPVAQKAIWRGMHFRNLFIHPSVMWRASTLTKISQYPSDLPHAEDYGFFFLLLQQGKAAILPETLLTCELNANGISARHRRQQLNGRMKTVWRYRRNIVLGLLGAMKLQLMRFVPYRVILRIHALLKQPAQN
ncbi:MAG TPA: glycosyltransferase [Puia sp.]|nr:glycosyltransferase [Puia sp.]